MKNKQLFPAQRKNSLSVWGKKKMALVILSGKGVLARGVCRGWFWGGRGGRGEEIFSFSLGKGREKGPLCGGGREKKEKDQKGVK